MFIWQPMAKRLTGDLKGRFPAMSHSPSQTGVSPANTPSTVFTALFVGIGEIGGNANQGT